MFKFVIHCTTLMRIFGPMGKVYWNIKVYLNPIAGLLVDYGHVAPAQFRHNLDHCANLQETEQVVV